MRSQAADGTSRREALRKMLLAKRAEIWARIGDELGQKMNEDIDSVLEDDIDEVYEDKKIIKNLKSTLKVADDDAADTDDDI